MVSVVFVASSVFWTTDVPYSEGDMAHIRLGFPLDFVSQNQSRHNMPILQQYRNIGFGSPLEDGVIIFWYLFFLNIVIMEIVFGAFFFCVYSLFPNTKIFFRFLSVKYILLALALLVVIVLGSIFGPFIYYSVFQGKEISTHIAPEMHVPLPTRLPSILPTEIPAKTP